MKKTRLLPALLALLSGGAILGHTAQAQILNSDFSNNLSGWTVLGSNTRVPFGFNSTPPGLGNFPGVVTLQNGVAIINSGPTGGLVASALTQTFSVPKFTAQFGKTGRLQLSSFGGLSAQANLSFDYQALSNENKGAPFDFVRGELNGKQLFVNDLRYSNTNGPGTLGFFRSSNVVHFSQEISALAGTTATLAFFGSDTIDASVASALAISNLKLTYSPFVLEDVDSINSVYTSGLPTALVQRELLLNVAFNANRDVNARIFRLRAEAGLRDGSAGPSGYSKDGKETKKEVVTEEKRWAFFATGAYGYRDQNNVDLTAGFTTDLFTATLGGEYKVTPNLTIGVAASRVESDNDLGTLGGTRIEGWSFDGYVSYAANHFYADLLYALGTYSNHIDRDTFNGTATANPDSLTNSIQFNTGYNLQLGRVITGPIAALNYVHGNIDGYNEQRAGVADLNVPSQHVNSLTSELGWQLSVPIHTGLGTITPQARASWVHEYMNTSKPLTVSLNDSPYYLVNGGSVSRIGGFSATGGTSAAGEDYASLGAGVAFEIGDRATVVLDYETRFFQDHASAQNVSLTGQIKF